MNGCVLDASALAVALGGKTDEASHMRARLLATRTHAPHLIDAETGNVLRRHEREGLLSADEALHALRVAQVLIDHRYPHAGTVAARAWALRHNLTYYDAQYVALADLLDLPLMTADSRISRAPGLPCSIKLVEA